jgi:hypothetical protein
VYASKAAFVSSSVGHFTMRGCASFLALDFELSAAGVLLMAAVSAPVGAFCQNDRYSAFWKI